MSIQTGSKSLPPPPLGAPLGSRLKLRIRRWLHDPNPVWMRELRQSTRLQRTPVILMAVTMAVALLICSVGGIASVTTGPARVGVGIFHTFFSVAFALVSWLGPAVASNTIAGEKNGRTWEALALTGLSPAQIARGKFLSAYTYVALYLVMLAPVGGLTFLFGGVTATEVLLAFFCCFVFAALSVAFGLSVSSKFQSSAAAIIVTLLVAFSTSFAVYMGLGVGLSVAAHDWWPAVQQGPPVWLPTAWVRAELGLPFLAFLVVLPAAGVLIPAWLFYEVTIANLAGPSDDRSSRLRIWTIVSTVVLTGCCGIVASAAHHVDWAFAQVGFMFAFFLLNILMVAGEPLGPSRRVEVIWQRLGVGRTSLRRAVGPGVVGATLWLVGLMLMSFAACVGIAFLTLKTGTERKAVTVLAGQLVAFLGFLAGISAFFRSRAQGATGPRLLLVVTLLLLTVGPWIIMAIAGVMTRSGDATLALAAPSPTFAFMLASEIQRGSLDADGHIVPAILCATGYAMFGLGFLGMAGGRTHARLARQRARTNDLEARLEAELEAERAAQAPVSESAPEPGEAPPAP